MKIYANIRIWSLFAGASLALSGTLFSGGPSMSEECLNYNHESHADTLLHAYANAGKSNYDYYSVGGIGNELFLLSPDLKPISAQTLAELIRADPRFKVAKFVLLDWSFSRRGSAPYATRLENSLGKPVLGYSGPTWWFSDGSVISVRSDSAVIENLTTERVAECATSDGNYHRETECKAVLATHSGMKAIYGNEVFVLDCEQIHRLRKLSDLGNRVASAQLFKYYAFVARNPDLEEQYSMRASVDLWPSDP